MEGNLRQASTKLRLAVQVVDAVSGTHLWAETYERTFSPENIFALQDDLVPRIVSTVADGYGILPHNICDALRRKPDDQLTPHEAVLRAFSYFERITPEEHAQVREILERAARSAPDQCEIWAMLSTIYWHEHAHGFNLQPDPLGRALAAARRSVDAAPSNNLGHSALAATLFLQKNFLAFRPAAERAIELNPMDGSNLATMGLLMAYSGDWEHGCALVESALQLNPHHPGWYWYAHFFNAYRKGDYRGALSIALKFNMPGYFYTHALTAAVYGQLSMREPAQKALQELLAIRPDFAGAGRTEFEKFYDSELVEQLIDGLRKAGLEIRNEAGTSATMKKPDSGATRADEGFWVAVLPFKCSGSNAELTALAEGLTEDIVTGLSRFSYLRVIARSSTLHYASQSADMRSAGKELGARYVLEGSLRQAGTKLRLAVQLVDAVTGAHLWAENYERNFNLKAVFDVQDDLVPRIVSTVADQHGILPRGISEELRGKNEQDLTPHEAVLRSFSFIQRISPTEHATARRILERAVEQDPNQADAWAMLAILYDTEFADEYNPRPNPLERAMAAAQRAVDLAPTHAFGYYALAFTYFFRKDNAGFRAAVEQAVALNPMDGSVVGMLGLLVHHVGETDRGTRMVEAAMQLNPHYPPVFRAPAFLNAYAQGKYADALELAVRFNMPGFFHALALRAAALGQLGQREAGQQAVQELLALRPDFATSARRDYGKWWNSKTVEHLIDGLRKAGLDIAPEKEGEASTLAPARSSASDPGTFRAEERSPSAEGVSGSKSHRIVLAIAVILLLIGAVGVAAYLKTSKTGQIDSIAVLPLENRSNDPDSDYIPDGITESINNSLARLPSLKVIPHSVAFHYKGKAMDVRKVGDELHVQAVLAGSVAQRGDDLTIAVELDDVRNGKQLWGEQYHRKLADLLAVQSDIAREVSQRLRSQLSAEDQKKLTKGSTDNPEAYRLYLKGKYYTDKLTKEGFDTGIDYFDQAIAVDPNYGLAYSGLAYNYVNQMDWYMSPSEAGPKTKEAAEKALAIDGSDARAHLTLAILAHWYEWKWAAAEDGFKRTLELSPNNAEALSFYAWFLAPMGRNDEAVAEARRGQQSDPLSPFASFSVGGVLVFAKQWDAAIEQLLRAIELDPNFWFSHCFLGRAYEQKRKFPEAIAEFQRALEIEKDNTEIWSGLGHAYAVSGKKSEAQKVLDHLKEASAHGWVAPYNVAVIYAGLGEKDQAFALLERAYKDRSYYMATYLATDERLDNLRSDPRFADLRKRVGFPEGAEMLKAPQK
jgi:TolB-like protein/Tfp pilus assembly protein PilF